MPDGTSTAHTLNNLFSRFASTVAHWAGHPITFGVAVVMLLVWAAFGPLMDYSNGWQLLVNTSTTICTFLMVFVIQYSQNRDGLAAQIKLDEIILSIKGAQNAILKASPMRNLPICKGGSRPSLSGPAWAAGLSQSWLKKM